MSTAIQIADVQGLEALSMRHVADVLGAGAMSLYHYISGKDELIDLMTDSVFRRSVSPARKPSEHWRIELEYWARWEWAVFTAHPWALQVVATLKPPLVPSVLANVEWPMGVLDGQGVDPVMAHRIVLTVDSLVQGMALLRVSEIEAERRDEVSLTQWRTVQVATLLESLGTENYPMQVALRRAHGEAADLDRLFEFGLNRVLDGLALFLGQVDASEAQTPGSSGTGHSRVGWGMRDKSQ